jgi:hypothetical protein
MPGDEYRSHRKPFQARNSRDSARVDPIRLGRDRLPVLSLDAVDDSGRKIIPGAQRTPEYCWADWNGVARAAGLTRAEQLVFFQHWRDGQQSAVAMGLTPHQLAAINRGIRLKLRKHAVALRPFLAYLSEPEIILEENFTTVRNREILSTTVRSFTLTLDKLGENLKAESAKLERIQERTHVARVAHEEAERSLEALIETGKAEESEAILTEQKWPSEAHERKVIAARKLITTTAATLSASKSAMDKQAGIVTQVSQEVEGRKYEAFLVAFDPARAKMHRLMSEFAQACLEVRMISSQHGIDGYKLAFELFPYGVDGEMSTEERLRRIGVMNSVYGLADHLGYAYARAV